MKHIKQSLFLFFFASLLGGQNTSVAMNGQIDKLGKLVLPTNIDATGRRQYYQNKELISLAIPSNITKLSNQTFLRCSNLEEINIDNGLQQIESLALSGNKIKEINLPSTIKVIERDALSYNTALTKISFAKGTENCLIKKGALFKTDNLQEIVHHGGVTFEEDKYNNIANPL